MKIISIIDWFRIGNGATSAITAIDRFLKPAGIEHTIICDYFDGQLPSNAHVWSESLLPKIMDSCEQTIFHYYLSGGIRGKGIFKNLITWCKRNSCKVPIVTTVLQRPSYPYSILTPYIINNSSHLIFIDKASYNDQLYSFIPEDRKSMFYCSFPISDERITHLDNLAKQRESHNKEVQFIYGRGSVINKCPKDTIDIFKKISVKSKYFIICGVDDDTWIAKDAKGELNIETMPNKSYQEWEAICSTFDVFLYYLPKDTYSSLDGNLGLAMKLGIPPIVYGPVAPKERIIHGINGFIANTKDEIIEYAEKLYEDDELRKTMGKNARDMTYSMLHGRKTVDGHIALYEKLSSGYCGPEFSIPNSLALKCFIKHNMFMLKLNFKSACRAIHLLFINPKLLVAKFLIRLKR